MAACLWTIGHSTRPIEDFIALLRAHGVVRLIDVRTMPRSRHNPQFNTDDLAASLRAAGIQYRHMPDLGGLRKAKKDSVNLGWRNVSFRGYADYMQTESFQRALEELMAENRLQPTAIMCAEAVPWRCHRSLISDAWVTRGGDVRHIMTEQRTDLHKLTPFAKVEDGCITYPRPADEQVPDLFE